MVRKLQDNKDVVRLPPAKHGAYFIQDGVVPHLRVRIGTGGAKRFVMRSRFGQAKHPTTRTIGDANKMTIESAREIALRWNNLNRKGIDPWEEEILAKLEDEKFRRRTFKNALEDYIATLPFRLQNRKADDDAKTLRREFLDPERIPWLDKTLKDVTGADVQRAIEAIRDRPARTQAYNVYSLIKTFFAWTVTPLGMEAYGITHSPVATLKKSTMMLQRNLLTRRHTSEEIRAYFAACGLMDYPMNEFLRAVLLTGQRKNEVRLAEWSEVDMANKIWTIPASRFKMDRQQPVPLSVPMLQLLGRIKAAQGDRRGPFIFSRNDGLTAMPFNGCDMDKFRAKLTEIFLANNPEANSPEHWTLHDDRRTVRSALSNLGVPEDVAEAVIGHNKKKLEETYNKNSFKIQRRRALHMWAEEVKFILDDPDHSLESEENVVPDWPSRWNETDPARSSK